MQQCKSCLIWAERWLCYWRRMNRSLGCVLGILYLISEEANGYSPSTDTLEKAVCKLSTYSSLWERGHFSSSHYFSLFHFLSSSPKHHALHQPSSSILVTPLLSSSFPFTNLCLFPVYNLQHTIPWAGMHDGDKKVMIDGRLCWQSFLPACRIQSIHFLFAERGWGLLRPFRLSLAAAHACLLPSAAFGYQDVLVSHNYTSV